MMEAGKDTSGGPSMSSGAFFGGAGAVVCVDEAAGVDAYLVTPASHVGRVVTGVVLLSETPSPSPATRVDRLGGLASVAFADKLAEQGYKVLVIDGVKSSASESGLSASAARAEQAAAFLKEHQDIQRVALLGYGAGADVAMQMVLTPASSTPAFHCFVVLSPNGRVACSASDEPLALPPALVLVGGKTPFATSDSFRQLQLLYEKNPPSEPSPLPFRSRVFAHQTKGFAFSGITDEDAATLAIAEILDWLVLHLHRFRTAACTSDTDPWWPQGRNGPFCNVGQKTWQDTRSEWLTATVARPPRPPAVPSHLLFDGLSSMRRTFDLPHRMALGDVVELFVEIWEVQQ